MPNQSWMPRFILPPVLTPDYNSQECNKNANCIFSPEIQFGCITKPRDQWCCPQTRDYRTNFSLYRFFSDHCSYIIRQTRIIITAKPLYNTVYHNIISHITWKWVNAGYWLEYELTKILHTSPSSIRYGVSFMSILKINNHVIKTLECISLAILNTIYSNCAAVGWLQYTTKTDYESFLPNGLINKLLLTHHRSPAWATYGVSFMSSKCGLCSPHCCGLCFTTYDDNQEIFVMVRFPDNNETVKRQPRIKTAPIASHTDKTRQRYLVQSQPQSLITGYFWGNGHWGPDDAYLWDKKTISWGNTL